jgi:hypothetical protein
VIFQVLKPVTRNITVFHDVITYSLTDNVSEKQLPPSSGFKVILSIEVHNM